EGRLVLRLAPLLAADPVDRAVARGGGEPAAGVGRYAGLRPLLQCGLERLARRLLGDVDVTEAADERGDQAAVLLAEDPLDGRRSVLHRSVFPRAGSGQAAERTDLDLAPARLGPLGRELERHVEVGRVDDPETSNDL